MSKKNRSKYNEYYKPEKFESEEEVFVEIQNEEPEEQLVEIEGQESVWAMAAPVFHGKVSCDLLNVRAMPVVEDNIMCMISKDTEIEFERLDDPEWLMAKISDNGVTITGYVMSQFIEEI